MRWFRRFPRNLCTRYGRNLPYEERSVSCPSPPVPPSHPPRMHHQDFPYYGIVWIVIFGDAAPFSIFFLPLYLVRKLGCYDDLEPSWGGGHTLNVMTVKFLPLFCRITGWRGEYARPLMEDLWVHYRSYFFFLYSFVKLKKFFTLFLN